VQLKDTQSISERARAALNAIQARENRELVCLWLVIFVLFLAIMGLLWVMALNRGKLYPRS
jgi:hypothetical protein